MLYSEFVEGTGCKQTEKNYEIYRGLELVYMNTELTKEEVYKMGKKLVDNSPSEEELKQRGKIMVEVELVEKAIKDDREIVKWKEEEIERYEQYIENNWCDNEEEEESFKRWIKDDRSYIKNAKQTIKSNKQKLRTLKEMLKSMM